MRGYGSWSIGWREGERLPNGPPSPPGCLFWGIIGVILYACVMTAIQGHPFALVIGLAVLAGALKGSR